MNYKVKPGDTLSKIANRNGLTLDQLLALNPKFKASPNSIKVGDILSLPESLSTADTQPFPVMTNSSTTPASGSLGLAVAAALGTLSAKYETGGRGPGTVSTGSGDSGGVSYGSYQMATKSGTVRQFVSQPGFRWRNDFLDLTPGTPPFTAKWKEIALAEPLAFQEAQHEFIRKTLFDALVEKIKRDDALDVTKRSRTLQDVVWSTAVQHGGNTAIVHRALANVDGDRSEPDFDKQLICAIYAERGRKNDSGNLAYFSKSSAGVQAGVSKRFENEEIDALKMLGNEV